MSTANFKSMDNFPLYVFDFDSEDEEDFEISEYWEDWNYVEGRMIEKEIDEYNDMLKFHRISLKSGYYTGVQFYVEDLENMDKYPEEYTNGECQYLFGMCRSKTFRAYHSEQNKIRKWLKKIAKKYGFFELFVVGRFSNGETIYQKI